MLANLNLISGDCAYKYIFPCPSYEAQNPDNIQHVQIYGENNHQPFKIVMFDNFLKKSVIFSSFSVIFSLFSVIFSWFTVIFSSFSAILSFQFCTRSVPIIDNIVHENYTSTMQELLKSAKHNLEHEIEHFALLEHQRLSQFLFEKAYKFNFTVNFEQKSKTKASAALKEIIETGIYQIDEKIDAGIEIGMISDESLNILEKLPNSTISGEDIWENIRELNKWDIELYDFAEDLFYNRVKFYADKIFVEIGDHDLDNELRS